MNDPKQTLLELDDPVAIEAAESLEAAGYDAKKLVFDAMRNFLTSGGVTNGTPQEAR